MNKLIYFQNKVSNVKTDGLCTIAVGTPDYISPEILKAMEGSRNSGTSRLFSHHFLR